MRKTLLVIAALCACSVAAEGIAQPVSVVRKQVSPEAARKMVDACMAFAQKNNALLAVAVVDFTGLLLSFHGLGGGPTTGETAILKAKTAARWGRSTTSLQEQVTSGGNQAPIWLGDFPRGGGLPIIIDGQLAGAIGVGGAGQLQEQCAQVGMDAVIPKAPVAATR